MKQLKFNSFLLTLLLSMAGITAAAHDIEVENEGKTIYYVWTNNRTELAVSCRGNAYDTYSNEYSDVVVIPESVTYNGATYPVTTIDGYAFRGCSGLTSVTIPSSVTSIGNYAFQGCSGLTSVTIPNSVTSIGDGAFRDCSGLTSVTIPNSVTSIGNRAFRDCSRLTSVTIPNSVTSIGGEAFFGTAWYNNQPDGVVYAGKVAYKYKGTMPANTSVSLQEGTMGIADEAFAGCSRLTNVSIPNSVTSIGDEAFSSCYALTSVTIPNSVTSIGSSAFSGCSGLTSVTIPNSVTSIGSHAFYSCSRLTSVTIGNSVTSIGYGAFASCSRLTNLIVDPGNTVFDSRERCHAIIETASNTMIAGCKNTIILNSVTSIGDDAFLGCSGLTSVTIPNSVTSIGVQTFYGCSGMTSVTIPNSVTSIGDFAFSRCSGLTSVTIPNSVTSIGGAAFSYCSGLKDVYCYAENVPTTSTYAFNNSPISTATLHVPTASLSSYQTTEPWSGFGQIVALQKCATPTIAFTNGKLTFECETEGVVFVYDISMTGSQSGRGNDIVLPGLPNTYAVSVYATKDGWVDSDVATKTLTFQAKTGDANGDGEITIADITTLINTILGNGNAAGSRAKVTENEEGR